MSSRQRTDWPVWAVFGVGEVAALAYPFVPDHTLASVWYLVVSALGVAMIMSAVVRHGRSGRRVWVAFSVGVSLFVAGDVLWTMEDLVWHIEPFPSVADVLYVSGYPALTMGLVWLLRGRQGGKNVASLLDAAIVTTGLGVLVGVQLVLPAMTDSSSSMWGRVMSSAYPLADLLLVAMVARLAFTPGVRLVSFWVLSASVAVILVADAAYDILVISGANTDRQPWLDVGWMQLYLLMGLAALHHTAPRLVDVAPRHDERLGRGRLALLAAATVLAPATLVLQVVLGKPLFPVFIAFGSIALFMLVLLRVAGLLRQVQAQTALLEVMARSDALTGLPNRGTWDHELGRVTDDARERGRSAIVAMLDLDRFKRYNDTQGHIAGDRLLMELAAVWRSHVSGRGVLARYGGEEFALVVPGMSLPEVEQIVAEMCRLVPDGQSASAGVAVWEPSESIVDLMLRADAALYAAKRSGRDAVRVATRETAPEHRAADIGQAAAALTPRVVFQPIVDLATGRIVAVEALSRFDLSALPPDEVFARAWLRGHGPELEAAAIAAALAQRRRFGTIPIHVNVSARGLVTAQIRAALPADLHGVVLEITEQDMSSDAADVEILRGFRARGAVLAIDDFGVGFSNLRRMVGLRPEIVKIDRSLITDIHLDMGSRSVVASVAGHAKHTHHLVCAEGIETEAELRTVIALGVPHGQGYLFSRPVSAEEVARLMHLPAGLLPVGLPAAGPGLTATA